MVMKASNDAVPAMEGVWDIVRTGKGIETHLQALYDLATVRDTAELAIERVVAQARRSGASWSEIAVPLGVTKQAVAKRYSTD